MNAKLESWLQLILIVMVAMFGWTTIVVAFTGLLMLLGVL